MRVGKEKDVGSPYMMPEVEQTTSELRERAIPLQATGGRKREGRFQGNWGFCKKGGRSDRDPSECKEIGSVRVQKKWVGIFEQL